VPVFWASAPAKVGRLTVTLISLVMRMNYLGLAILAAKMAPGYSSDGS
jgi:hypothetical protein